MANPAVTAHALMLSACPFLIDALDIQTVPVVYINQARVDGALNEWFLMHHVLTT
ncbi:MAG: hypothetical protein M0Z36_03185 [Thermaerobacter sp.]|nr:hypothetical protein [Thermaerobacter sp.]